MRSIFACDRVCVHGSLITEMIYTKEIANEISQSYSLSLPLNEIFARSCRST